jgi:predicted nucleotidyltransferase
MRSSMALRLTQGGKPVGKVNRCTQWREPVEEWLAVHWNRAILQHAYGAEHTSTMKTLGEMTRAERSNWEVDPIDAEAIQEMVSRIVAVCDPEKVVVFGSHARGDAHSSSDIDFLVINETDLPRPKRSVALYSALREYPCSKDILVYTPAEVHEYSELPQSFVMTALREGTVAYAK